MHHSPPPPPMPHSPHSPNVMENGGQHPGHPKSSVLSFCLSVVHNLTQLCIGAVVISLLILVITFPFSQSLKQHVILCSVGYFVLMTQAILLFSPFGWANHLKYENKRLIHAAMQVIGAALVIAGSIVRMIAVNNNFSTPHGICGILAMVLAALTLAIGALGFFFPQTMNTKIMKIFHALLGALTLTFAFITVIIGFHNIYRVIFGDVNANLAIVLSVVALLGTLLMAGVKNVKRVFQ